MSFALSARDKPNYEGARRAADRLTAIYSEPPIPVTEIAEEAGINVVLADMGQFADAVAGFCDFEARRIYVNRADIAPRRTFTIAHELGHWLLHRAAFEADPERYPVLPRFQKVDDSNAFEREANAFAASLLVPEHLLKPVRGHPVALLAHIFGVSRAMMEIRHAR